MDIEPTEPIHALQLAESVKRYLASTRDELEKLRSLFFVKGAYGTPEPLDLRGRGRVVVVIGVILPVVYVDVWKTRDQ